MFLKKLIAAFLFLISVSSFGQSADEAVARLTALDMQMKSLKPVKLTDGVDMKASIQAFAERMSLEDQIEKERAKLSMIIYRDILKSGNEAQVDEVINKGNFQYKGQNLIPFKVAIKTLKGTELVEFSQEILKFPKLSEFIALYLERDGLQELGRSFVRQGFTQDYFKNFFDKLNQLALRTENWYINKYSDNQFQQIVSGMLIEARQMNIEDKVVAQIVLNFKGLSTKAKTTIISSLAQSQSPSAYTFIRSHFNSKEFEIRKSALGSLFMIPFIEATMI